ncbi:MAG: class I SAM-dependent RNA methyltransferase [Proteobacteria bacterium]|jgi:putative N6-adenine-specific DNA methylase|nr:class I SAM-dependent RNA methyltransferase [Pseudomonadota bacterium]
MTERFFASCPRGLEGELARELDALGASGVVAAEGGVGFAGELTLACRANLESRIASRVLWRVGAAAYRDERDLHAAARAIDWPRLFRPDRTLRVDVAATRSPLGSLGFATLTIKDAVCDRFRDERGVRPSIDKREPDVRVHAHLTEREATFYLDTSGEALFKRGWRRSREIAPLRENLAAGLLALAKWTPDEPLLDPMCGSGTIAIEAALIAARRAPGLTRSFGFQKLAWYDGPTWQRIRQAARDRIVEAPAGGASIFASDASAAAVERTHANLAAAEVAPFVEVARADVLDRAAPAPAGVLLANPPYGVRVDEADRLAALYPRLGDALKSRFAGWRVCLFTGDLRLPRLIGLKPERRTPLWNGALECRLYAFRIVAGPMRVRGSGG